MNEINEWLANHPELIKDYKYISIRADVLLSDIVDLYRLYDGKKIISSEIKLTNTNLYSYLLVKVDLEFKLGTTNQLRVDVKKQALELTNSYLFEIRACYEASDLKILKKNQASVEQRVKEGILENQKVYATK